MEEIPQPLCMPPSDCNRDVVIVLRRRGTHEWPRAATTAQKTSLRNASLRQRTSAKTFAIENRADKEETLVDSEEALVEKDNREPRGFRPCRGLAVFAGGGREDEEWLRSALSSLFIWNRISVGASGALYKQGG
ncbi:RHOMBOID-like protein 3 [Striga asiatica]|uniref:RHOMBOID-like protein 3 n=1 Tax=Striga asiatica TaxID=4170 RepID=A0A5A7NUM6_STRAF|nr:RHOMBOID-like protein 3 [Striga asiatica]